MRAMEELAVKLMLKVAEPVLLDVGLRSESTTRGPSSTYANSRGADKVLYAGYFPMGFIT